MLTAGAATATNALATDKLVSKLNQVLPATKGFATAFLHLKSGSMGLATGATSVSAIVSLLKSGGTAAQPLLRAMEGIAGHSLTAKTSLADVIFGKKSSAQKVASKTQWEAAFFGTKDQKLEAKQMRVEADSAAIGVALTRGWPTAIATAGRIAFNRGMHAVFTPTAIAGAIAGASIGGTAGTAGIGLLAGRIMPPLIRGLGRLVFGSRQSAGALGTLGSTALSVVPKLNTVQRAIDNVRLAASGQGLSVAHGIGLGAFAVAAGSAISGIAGVAGNHNGESASRTESVGISAAKHRRTVESTSQLDFAAKSVGSSLSSLDGAFDHLSEVMSSANDGTESAINKFTRLGLSADSLKRLSIDERMARVGAALRNVQNPIDRDRLAMDLLGESGHALVPMLTDLDNLRNKATSSGAVISAKDVQAAQAMKVAIASLKTTLTNAWNQIGAASIQSTTLWVSGTAKFLEKNEAVVQMLLKVVAGIGAAAGGIVLWSYFGGPVVAIIKSIGMAVAALMSPIGLVALAIGAGVAAWMYFTQSGRAAATYLGQTFTEFVAFFKEAWGGIVAAVGKGDLALAGQIAWTAMKLGFFQAIDSMGVSWSGIMGHIYDGMNFLANAFSNAWAFAAGSVRSVQNSLAKFFLLSFKNLGVAWAVLCAGMVTSLAPAQNKIGKMISKMWGKLSGQSDADIAETMKSHDEETLGIQAKAETDRQAAMAKVDGDTAKEIKRMDDEANADIAKIEADRQNAVSQNDQRLAERKKALLPDEKRIADLKAEQATLIERANAAGSDPGKKPPVFTPDTPQMGGSKEASVVGTFSAAAAAGMGGGGPMSMIAKSTAQTVAELKELREALKEKRHAKDDALAARNFQKSAQLRGARFGK